MKPALVNLNISEEHVYIYFSFFPCIFFLFFPCIFLSMLFTNYAPQRLIYSLHGHMMDDLFLMPLLGTATVQPNARRYLTIAFHRNRCHLFCSGPLLITADHISPTPVTVTFSSQWSETFPFVSAESTLHFLFGKMSGYYQTGIGTG